MPYCAVNGCKSNSKKDKDVSWFRLPRIETNRTRYKSWISYCNRKDFTPSEHSRLCSKHFSPSQYERNPTLLASFGYPRAKPVLRSDAVPDVTGSTVSSSGSVVKRRTVRSKATRKVVIKIPKRERKVTIKTETTTMDETSTNEEQTIDQALLDVPEAANPLQCRYCGRILARVLYRKEHERIHTGEKPFACGICDKKFRSQGTCHKHERSHSSRKKSFECEHCGRRYYNFLQYRAHLRAHEKGDKPFSCHICDRSFALETVLKKHLLFHDEQKQYRCSHCSKSFSTTFDLKEHQRSHAGQSLYKCRYCNLRFGTEKRRNIHEKCHERSDVHECKECGATFKSANLLATHEAKSEMAGGCYQIVQQEANVPSTSNGVGLTGDVDIGYLGQTMQIEGSEISDIHVLNGHSVEMEDDIYPTGLLRTTYRGIVKQEPMNTYENVVEQNGIDSVTHGSNNSITGDDIQQYILSPNPPASASSNGFCIAPTAEKTSQTEPRDVDELYDALEAAGKVHECKSCQILFRNYTMFLVHKTLHANPERPFSCHLCDNVARDNVDFNAHLIWHMK